MSIRHFEAQLLDPQAQRPSHLNHFTVTFRFQILTTVQVHLALCLGPWFIALNLEYAYYHIPIILKYWHFLTMQVGETVLQFTVLSLGQNIVPLVFKNMMKPMTLAISYLDIKILMYLNDRLV